MYYLFKKTLSFITYIGTLPFAFDFQIRGESNTNRDGAIPFDNGSSGLLLLTCSLVVGTCFPHSQVCQSL